MLKYRKGVLIMKIMIVGYSGSGKSTLAKILNKKYGVPVLHLDAVHHLPGWMERPRESEIEIVNEFLNSNDSWIIDGNYSKVCEQRRLQESDLIIMMLFGRFACFLRAYRRYRKYKGKSRPDMAEGCDEKFDKTFRRWLLFGGRKRSRRSKFDEIKTKYSSKVKVIRNQRELDEFVKRLED